MNEFIEQAKNGNWEQAYNILSTTKVSRWSVSLRRKQIIPLFNLNQSHYEHKCYEFIHSMLESAKESL